MFVQMMEIHSPKFDEVRDLDRQWYEATEGKRTLRRDITLRDRTDPDHIVVLAFFDSYESAMENSALRETDDFAQRLGTLAQGAIDFSDFDVVEERS